MIDKIIDTVLEYYDITREELFSAKTTYEIHHARKMTIYFVHQKTGMAFYKIAPIFGRNTSSCFKIVEKILNSKNKYLKKQLVEIDALIGS
jgi:chromosomal replication initiation ATPase DnaA